MTEEKQQIDRNERRLDRLETVVSELAESQSALQADVKTILKNQEGVFKRMNRPVGPVLIGAGAILISMIGVFATILTLMINPIKDNIDTLTTYMLRAEQEETVEEARFEDRMNIVESKAAVSEESRRWLERMTGRNNQQIDEIWRELKAQSKHQAGGG